MLTEDEKGRLTKKAQKYIDYLEREVEIERRKAEELNSIMYGNAESDVTFDTDYSEPARALPEGSGVNFYLHLPGYPEHVKRPVHIRIDSSGDLLVCGDKGLTIRPGASNVVRINYAS